MPRRKDATLVKTIKKFQELTFHIMPKKTNSNFLYEMTCDLDETFAFLNKINATRDENITLFEIILASLARTGFLRPKCNRFIKGRRLWQRNEMSISFVVKREKTDEGEEVNSTIRFSPYDTLEDVSAHMKEEINEARHGVNPNAKDVKLFGAMPRFFLRLIAKFVHFCDNHHIPLYSLTKDLPFYATAFVAHLGSLGMDGGWHHLYEMGTTEIFIVISKIKYGQVINPKTGDAKITKIIKLNINIDERVADGIYWGKTLDMIQDFIEHPAKMMQPPQMTDTLLEKLHLKDYPPSQS